MEPFSYMEGGCPDNLYNLDNGYYNSIVCRQYKIFILSYGEIREAWNEDRCEVSFNDNEIFTYEEFNEVMHLLDINLLD